MIKISTFRNCHHFIKSKIYAPIKIFTSNFFPESIFDIPSDWDSPLCVSFWSTIFSDPSLLQEERDKSKHFQ